LFTRAKLWLPIYASFLLVFVVCQDCFNRPIASAPNTWIDVIERVSHDNVTLVYVSHLASARLIRWKIFWYNKRRGLQAQNHHHHQWEKSIGFSEHTCENPTLLEVTYRQLVPKLTIYIVITYVMLQFTCQIYIQEEWWSINQSHKNPKVF
jgi:hypothetical protein